MYHSNPEIFYSQPKRMDSNATDGGNPPFLSPNSSPKLPTLSPYLTPFGPSQFQFEFKSAGGSESSADAPKPLDCLHEAPIPPFLSKTYDLVDDSSLDAIISWGEKGDTFVVWNPLEFSRLILPRNFKHDNFSSFIRQLNTYGFRKIGTEKWEFINEGFVKGQRSLLRRIQRRKSHQSQQVGSSIEIGKPAMEAEIRSLRKERSSMMQELVQLQHQQCGTVQRVEVVKERLEASEKRQKQMVSFLAKMLRKPAFLASVKQARKQKSIDSHGPARKCIKQEPREPDHVPSLVEGISQNEMATVHGLSHMPKQGETVPTLATTGSYIKQEDVMIPQPLSLKECSTNFPGDLIMEKSISDFSLESINTANVWDLGCETGVGMSDLWDNLSNDNNPLELGDIWGIGSPHSPRNLGFENWLHEE